jgi:hypothetical protein
MSFIWLSEWTTFICPKKINRLVALFATWTLRPVSQLTALTLGQNVDCCGKTSHNWGNGGKSVTSVTELEPTHIQGVSGETWGKETTWKTQA